MQPRKRNAPTWADAPRENRAAETASDDKGKAPAEDEMSVDEPANTEGLSDLEWMRKRMSKGVDQPFQKSDDEGDAPPVDTPEEVRCKLN